MHHIQGRPAPKSAPPDRQQPDSQRLAELEAADPTLTPLLASIVSQVARREPLPPG